jgi:uroporphyrinogen-III decarboxylase
MLHDIGFDVIHSSESNDLRTYKETWQGKLAFAGGFPAAALRHDSQEDITQRVKEICAHLTPGGGYLFSVSGTIGDDIPPKNFMAMTQALHRYGRFLHSDLDSDPTRMLTP